MCGFDAHFTPAVEILWRFARSSWGHGYATEAAHEACRIAFEELRLSAIVTFTVPANLRSRAVVERLVMTHDAGDDFDHPKLAEGHPLRRHVLYRLSLTSWAKGITVREERASDIDAIYRVEVAAFHTDAEAKLVDELRSNGALTPSLVADVPGEVVGHIAFSPIFVDSDAGRMVGVGLAPMAVRPVVPRRRSRPEIFASEAARGDSPRAKSGSEAWRELARHRRRPYVRGSVTEMELAFDPLQLPLCVRVGDTSCDG